MQSVVMMGTNAVLVGVTPEPSVVKVGTSPNC